MNSNFRERGEKKMRKMWIFFVCAVMLMLPSWVLADSISPSTVDVTLAAGESVTIHKTVTLSAGTPSVRGDIFFLTDSTGSMGPLIGSVIANASTILGNTGGLGDIAWGVGEYKDNGDTFVYRRDQDMTTNSVAALAGINMWGASGGGDLEEANLYALKQVSDTTSWRSGTDRVLLWFGDSPGHDPSGPDGTTEAQAIAALQAPGITVEALDLNILDLYGQATRIAAATGGSYFSGVDPVAVGSAINAALAAAFAEYFTVALSAPSIPGLTITVSAPYTGDWTRNLDRSFLFDVNLTADTAGTYGFDINALVDGGIVATERDNINGVPEPSSLLLLSTGLSGIVFLRRKFLK